MDLDRGPPLPIPLRNAIRLLVEVARAEAPDAPYRPARYRSAFEIGFIGAAALDGPTVRAGLRRLAQSMPLHCTHELFTVDTAGSTITVRDGWTMKRGDAETLHYVQQCVAAVLDMIAAWQPFSHACCRA